MNTNANETPRAALARLNTLLLAGRIKEADRALLDACAARADVAYPAAFRVARAKLTAAKDAAKDAYVRRALADGGAL